MPFFRRRSRAPVKESDEESAESRQQITDSDARERKSEDDDDFSLDIKNITLQLGETTATFMSDGTWRYSCGHHDPEKRTFLKLKNKQSRFIKENKKLKEKYDFLFQRAQTVTAEYCEVEKELKLLRKILKKTPLFESLGK